MVNNSLWNNVFIQFGKDGTRLERKRKNIMFMLL